jgi:hypothetical protein
MKTDENTRKMRPFGLFEMDGLTTKCVSSQMSKAPISGLKNRSRSMISRPASDQEALLNMVYAPGA